MVVTHTAVTILGKEVVVRVEAEVGTERGIEMIGMEEEEPEIIDALIGKTYPFYVCITVHSRDDCAYIYYNVLMNM